MHLSFVLLAKTKNILYIRPLYTVFAPVFFIRRPPGLTLSFRSAPLETANELLHQGTNLGVSCCIQGVVSHMRTASFAHMSNTCIAEGTSTQFQWRLVLEIEEEIV